MSNVGLRTAVFMRILGLGSRRDRMVEPSNRRRLLPDCCPKKPSGARSRRGGLRTRVAEVAALVVWPAVVVAVGLSVRRVGRQRKALAQLMATQEDERQRIALELHDRSAQELIAALLALGRVESAAKGDSGNGRRRSTTPRLIGRQMRPRPDEADLTCADAGVADGYPVGSTPISPMRAV